MPHAASSELSGLERLKISCFSQGIALTDDAVDEITHSGDLPLSVHEYATTGGVTVELEHDVYVNAPFDEWFCTNAQATLVVTGPGEFGIVYDDNLYPVRRVLPLPGYLRTTDSLGRPVTDAVMSHADRIRLSPVGGCAYDCHFCDLPADRYTMRPVEQLLAAFAVARSDPNLPPRHVLVSGGAPGRKHREDFEKACTSILAASDLPVDFMMTAWPDDIALVDRLVDANAHGFSLNIELYGDEASNLFIKQKNRFARSGLEGTIARAVELTGGNGRVRSLIIVGLEPLEQTLAGVEWLARLGCDPVLSPFRPAFRTKLETSRPPTADMLERAYLESREIVDRHGVQLGPRCVPCQHNTLTFPADMAA